MSPRQVTVGGKKQCSKCKEWKPLDKFCTDRRTTSGKTARCLVCINKANKERYSVDETAKEHRKHLAKKSTLKQRYGLTIEDVEKLLKDQNYRCCICNVILDKNDTGVRPVIDHDHATSKVRGILCPLCNVGLGSFRDNINFLISAINYLEEHNEQC